MKRKIKLVIMAMLLAVLAMAGATKGYEQEKGEGSDKTLSPYFFVKSDDPDLDALPLKSTSAEVNVAGVIADVTVTQVYKNEGKKALEAIYVFPASTRAAVYGLKMTIGERTITAKIKKRDEARHDYEQAKAEGKTASLLEEHRPNVFQMNVANILPGDMIKVELKYTELLVPVDGLYEVVYPTVVGPRYSNTPESTASPLEKWVKNPYLHQGEKPACTFDMTVNLATGLPIREITCPSHKVGIGYDGPSMAAVKLDSSEKHGGNRDFILRYRLAGEKIESGLLLFEGEKEKFFLLMTQPPKRVSDAEIPPREYIFIVDVSGSMYGFPLDISKKLLKDLIGGLRPTDKFNVLLFSGGSTVMSEASLPASGENIRRAIDVIERQTGGGGTELLPALKRTLSLPRAEGCSRTVIIVTDGYVSVEEEAFDLIRASLGKANMFAFGIGSSVNRYIIEGIARVGMGEPFIITKPEEARQTAERFRKLVQRPVLTGIKVDFGKFGAYEVEPPNVPDVLAERPVVIFGKWRGLPQGTITVKGFAGDGAYAETIDAGKTMPLPANEALRYLWARHRIATLCDYNKLRSDDKRIAEVTNLGLAYNLLTPYTSFVAVDTEVRLKDGQATTVKQPLPLPEGVSDYVVGSARCCKQSLLSPAVPLCEKGHKAEPKCKDQYKEAEDASAAASEEGPGIRVEKIAIEGGLSKSAVQRMIERHSAEIRACVKGTATNQKLVISLTVNSKGKVIKVSFPDGRVEKKMEKCLMKKLREVRFAPLEGGNTAIVTITIAIT
ncbi:MAG: VIT domain-containing protein [Pseudomonadota bacterium]